MNAGGVKFSVAAQNHAFKRHPGDVPIIVPALSEIVTNPLYLGDDLRNPGKIELIGRIRGHVGGALVSLTIEKNKQDDCYHVCSIYMISQAELDKKISKRIVKVARHR